MKKLLALLLGVALYLPASQPNIANAQFQLQQFDGDLKRQLISSSPAWFGYAIKTKQGDHQGCCWNNNVQYGCRLEGGGTTESKPTVQKSAIPLEGRDEIAVLYRSDGSGIGKVQMYSLDCPLDGGGLAFTWIEHVPARASLAFLEGLISGKTNEKLIDAATLAVAQHRHTGSRSCIETSYSAFSSGKGERQGYLLAGRRPWSRWHSYLAETTEFGSK